MTLTHEQVQRLNGSFAVNEHEWFNGFAYVDELAVCTRLDEVDPSWEFTRVADPVYGDNRVTIFMRMTVCGVTREDAGTSKLTGKKRDGGIFLIDEPEKNALTDALRRCARRFGVGRYLTILPDTVTDDKSLSDWLSKRNAGMPQSVTSQATNNGTAQKQVSSQAQSPETPESGIIRNFQVTRFETRQTDNDNLYYRFDTEENELLVTFSRDLFRAMKYPDAQTEAWKKPGFSMKFPVQLNAEYKVREDGSGYWLALVPEVTF